MKFLTMIVLAAAPLLANAEAVTTLKSFAQTAKTGKADFSQTVVSPNGKRKTSSGTFEFSRPNKFKFVYTKPFNQTMVADGKKVYLYDADLNQVTVRDLGAVLGSTPAVILSGGNIEKEFVLQNLEPKDGLEWVLARPKSNDGAIEAMKVAFRGNELAVLEIMDSFGQRSVLTFSNMETNPSIPDGTFTFTAPKGADVLGQ
jgi:outer membrane lipoprotein carrier protein